MLIILKGTSAIERAIISVEYLSVILRNLS